ncbi:MAG: Asp-tRNA(Asn)/Glu-tRNA(Gln) amidotransferase subunit GatA [Phycisphaeraceae bacterium]
MNLIDMTVRDLLAALAEGSVTSAQITDACLKRIAATDGEIHAFVSTADASAALAAAERIDARRQKGGPLGPLAGLPVAIKDNLCTTDFATTCSSKMLESFRPPYDATCVRHLRAADTILLGKTNMDEFAMGSSTENSAFAITRNPHDLSRVPGGTSGGSAAAVAAKMVPFAIGSDTGGSVRQPAAFCGVVGMKPTYGRISRYGLIAYASSFDQVGILARSVDDTALVLQQIAGHDPLDSTSLNAPVPDYVAAVKAAGDAKDGPLRIGLPREYFAEGLSDEVRRPIESLIAALKAEGHTVGETSLPHTEFALPAYYILTCAEASSNLARYDGVKYGYRAQGPFTGIIDMMMRSRTEGFGKEVQRRILLGTYVLSAGYFDAYYRRASKVRRLVANDFTKAFTEFDCLLHPITPTPAFKIGEKKDDPITMYLSDIYSVIANLAGLPAISLPCGWSSDKLPIGVQLIGPALSEGRLLAAASRVEQTISRSGLWKQR